MTPDELQAIAIAIIERAVSDHPDECGPLVALMLSAMLEAGLYRENDEATGEFVRAVNQRLGEIAAYYGSARTWRLVAVDADQD